MDTAIGIVALVIIVGGIVWIQSARDKKKRAGTTDTALVAVVRGEPSDIQQRFLRLVPARQDKPKGLAAALYLKEQGPGVLVYSHDATLGDFYFDSVVRFEPTADGATTVTQSFSRWLNKNGSLAKPGAMKSMRAATEAAIRGIDPSASISYRSTD